jgi:hypothetical protein
MRDLLNCFIDLNSQRPDVAKTSDMILAHAKFLGLQAAFIGDDTSLLRISGKPDQAELIDEFLFFMDPTQYSHRIAGLQ